jgi:tRNA-specific 2-thiouridylase
LRIISLQKEYWDHVVAYTMQEIKKGRTPNPDVLCNQRIKFGVFFDYITDQYDKVATGHYAQTDSVDGAARLLRAPDRVKDQTYFLSYLTQAQLQKALFPIGHLQKEQVRQLAHEYNLPTKDRKDSQGICFLGKLKFSDFIAYHVGENPGDIREYETGKKLGTHKGVWFHTIGQRQGSGLAGGPWYVVAKDVASNVVYMSREYHAPDKERKLFEVAECNWISGTAPAKKELLVKLRHGKQLHACTLEQIEPGRFRVMLAENDQGIAPGQFAVFYDDQICLGAGIIA